MTTAVRPPSRFLLSACDEMDSVVQIFIDQRKKLSPTPYEADAEALLLFNLVIRHVEGVVALARSDEVLVAPALVAARAAFETSVKAAWLVDDADPFTREARWLIHLKEEERVHERIAARLTEDSDREKRTTRAATLRAFRLKVASRMPPHVATLTGNPSLEEMIKAIGGSHFYGLYIYLSQYVHGGHLASWLYRRNLGSLKEFGEFVTSGHWQIALRLCLLSLDVPAQVVLDRISGHSVSYLSHTTKSAIQTAIDCLADDDYR